MAVRWQFVTLNEADPLKRRKLLDYFATAAQLPVLIPLSIIYLFRKPIFGLQADQTVIGWSCFLIMLEPFLRQGHSKKHHLFSLLALP